MSSTTFPPIPVDTTKAAHVVLGGSDIYLAIGDQANDLFEGLCLQGSSRTTEKLVLKLAMLYLATFFQHLESLPDNLAVDALRKRVDWKYALHLSLNPISIETSLLCEFRRMVSVDRTSQKNFEKLLERMNKIPHIAARFCSEPDAGQVIGHVCSISRAANIWEAINSTIQALAISNPNWLRTYSLPYWYERYCLSRKNLNVKADPQELEIFVQSIGKDGYYLLDTITRFGAQELMDLPEVFLLRKIWHDQFERENESVIWRKEACSGCSFQASYVLQPEMYASHEKEGAH